MNNFNTARLFFLVLVFSACQHTSTQIPLPSVPFGTESEYVFRPGTYKQKIEVRYVKDGKSEEHSFNAVLKYSPQEIFMYCYVGFGYTLFKLKDNLKDPPEFVSGDERIEKNKEFFLKMYPLIKKALLVRQNDSHFKNNEMTLLIEPEKFPVHILISPEKIKGVPKNLTFENEEHFRFFITTTDYMAL